MILSIDPFDTFGLCGCDKIVYGCVLYGDMASCGYFHCCDICDFFDLMNAYGCACDLNKGVCWLLFLWLPVVNCFNWSIIVLNNFANGSVVESGVLSELGLG